MTEYHSLSDLFEQLNTGCPYVVLRNFETFVSDFTALEHPDIDLLCTSREALLQTIDTLSRGREGDLIHRRARIAGKDVDIDLREVGDGYLDASWEEKILAGRVLREDGFYVPQDEDYYFSLLYHVLIQKKQIAPDYQERLKKFADQLGLTKGNSLLEQLEGYMRAGGYRYTYPESPSTAFFVSKVSKDLMEKNPKKKLRRLIHKILGR